jgi:hypothetical protein
MTETNTINASQKREIHKLGSVGYKVAMPKWDKMEHEYIARGPIPATVDWPEQARTYYYARGGMINPEDGTLLPGDQIGEIATRLVELIRMTAEGTFVPHREREMNLVLQ